MALLICSCDVPADDVSTGTSSDGDESDDSTTAEPEDTEKTPDVGDEQPDPDSDPDPDPVEEMWRATSSTGRLDALCVRPDDDIVIAGARAGDRGGPAFVQRISADGEVGWRAEFGSLGSTTLFHEVLCGPDGSIYAAGFADDLNQAIERYALPLLIKLDPETGDVAWRREFTAEDDVVGQYMGGYADASGVYVAGDLGSIGCEGYNAAYVTHFDTDGNNTWAHVADNPLCLVLGAWSHRYATLVHGDRLFVAGMDVESPIRSAVLETFTLDGTLRSEVQFDLPESRILFLQPDPSGDGVLASGSWETDEGTHRFVSTCHADSCDELFDLDDHHGFDGFATGHEGDWLVSSAGSVASWAPQGEQQWSWSSGLLRDFEPAQISDLAVDGTGAIVLGGGMDPPTVVKLRPR